MTRLMNFRALAYCVAILCWLSLTYLASRKGDDPFSLLISAVSLSALTLLILDSIRSIRTK